MRLIIAAAALALTAAAAVAQEPPKPTGPTASDPRGDARSDEKPVPQPQGAAPITPQPSDPKAAGDKEDVKHAPAQQQAPKEDGKAEPAR